MNLEGRSDPVPYTNGICGPTSLDIPGLAQEPVPMSLFQICKAASTNSQTFGSETSSV